MTLPYQQLADAFRAECQYGVDECKRLNYDPTGWQQMVASLDPIRATKLLVSSGKGQTGFMKLMTDGHPDLTVERLMLKRKYEPLFSAQEREAAQWRLDHWDALPTS